MEVLLVVAAGLIAAFVFWLASFDRRLPPGPWGLPILGYIPFLTSKPYVTFTKLAKRYGNVFSLRLGSRNVIVLNDFQSSKDAFMQDAFMGRPHDIPLVRNKENYETEAIFGLPWKEQRRLCLHTLRDLGLGKSKMEDHIQEEIKELLEHLDENVGKPISIRELLAHSVSNNIASLVFGKRFKYDDPIRQMLTRTVRLISLAAGQTGWLIFFPWIRKILTLLGMQHIHTAIRDTQELRDYIMKEIDEHEKTLEPNNIRDFIDAYLLEIKRRKNEPSFCKPVLQDIVEGFFAAGSDTVKHSVEWLVLTSASDPKAQRRIQDEIREVVGPDRLPESLDLKSMPYTSAFIMETMRWRTIVPINVLRYTLMDTELNGYFIPKHRYVLSNHWNIHHDPGYWGSDAEEFHPERFLDEEQKKVKKREHYIPFSIGKRACPGKPLAEVETFLYFVAILQRFYVRLPGGKSADFEGELGLSLQIKPQDFVLSRRTD